ncbi:MAG: hypothetical protein P857_940 [Candidatus Xenolissoclinum pacificiensis L6]|uniref:Basal-body rod modification protein FlgD n=1 Tax=Candidatus Xenolissoclinum pacificiensis L6 TaxID=1401685 RepID=W2V101_9RICK|nr:MAG: hypothetical protein P857_940 [Candidatus Xenolissoclinum pacificiensis L6]
MIVDPSNHAKAQDDFMQMFLAEVKFTDPTNPNGSADLMNMVSSFTMIEQMNNMNNNLVEIKQNIVPSNDNESLMNKMNRYSNFMNKYINADRSHIHYTGSDTMVNFALDQNVATVKIDIVNELTGKSVKTVTMDNLNKGDYTVLWDGTDSQDDPVSEGRYQVLFKAYNNNGTECNDAVKDLQDKKVQGIRILDNEIYLVLEDDMLVNSSNITNIRM